MSACASEVTADVPWFDPAKLVGIGHRYEGGCDRVPQLPKLGTPEREASDKKHRETVAGLLAGYAKRPVT